MSELLYRKALAEKLLDISGELKTGRDEFTWNSGLYKKLDKSIKAVLKVLDDHSGEEQLSEDVRQDLEEKIRKMKEAARPYREEKLEQGALGIGNMGTSKAKEVQRAMYKRFCAADDLIKVDNVIPRNPGVGDGIIAPDMLEPGDVRQTDWRLKWKQNVRYTAKKQINTCNKKLSEYDRSGELKQDEFDALMNLVDSSKILTYKNDAKLCQMYPELRINLEKAVVASEKLRNMSENEIAEFMGNWSMATLDKSVEAAKKAKERQGRKFTDKDRKNIEEKQEILIRDKIKKFSDKNKLISKGDVLYQVSRFVDLKMKVISDKNYVKVVHTNTLGRIWSVSDYDDLAKHQTDATAKKFYENLRDLRELERAGIKHNKPVSGIDKSFYKRVNETVNTTTKRELFTFRVGRPGFKGVGMANDSYGAKDNTTVTAGMSIGQTSKLRVGKVGLKLHSKHKSLQLSGGLAFGQVKTSTVIGANLDSSGLNMNLLGEANAIRARIKAKAGGKYGGISAGGNISVGHLEGKAQAAFGNVTVKDDDGKEHNEFGFKVMAGAVATAFKGGGSGSINILGIKIGASITAYAAGVGASAGTEVTVGGVGFSLSGALGLGVGLSININWSEAASKLKRKWEKSKLRKLINKHREKKQQKAKELPKLEELKPEEKHNDLGRKTVAEEPKKDEKVKKGITAGRLSHR